MFCVITAIFLISIPRGFCLDRKGAKVEDIKRDNFNKENRRAYNSSSEIQPVRVKEETILLPDQLLK